MGKNLTPAKRAFESRRGERGAALITLLLISALLLGVGGALILSTSMSLTNTTDATAEAQAYYAAEAGLQSALHVLRGNAAPTPLPVAIPVSGVIPDADKLSYRGAVTRSISNLSGDPTSVPMRLSQWVQYNYTPSGLGYADRVVLGSADTYSPLTGMAYSLEVTEPDNTTIVTYTTTAMFTGGGSSYTFGSGGNTATISFSPQTSVTVDATSPVSSNIGSFVTSKTGNGATVPVNSQVNIRIDLAKPWTGSIIMGGTISGKIDNSGGVNLKITFSSITAKVAGTLFTLSSNPFIMNKASSASGTFELGSTITAPEPRRLRVRSNGIGPRGARKVMEMIVTRYKYDIQPAAPITIRGADDTTVTMTFDLGSSNAKKYSGKDYSNIQPKFPVIAIRTQDWTAGYTGMGKGATIDNPKFAILDIDTLPSPWPTTLTPVPSSTPTPPTPPYPFLATTPDFLQTADLARAFLDDIEATARAKGRYFSSLNGYADYDNTSANIAKPALTFVGGNCTLSGGSGLLVVTGNLDFTGNDDFQGIILVLGNGHVTRSGTGNGRVLGGWMVASFSRTGTTGFTAPYFDVSGGGSGQFYYDTTSIEAANKVVGSTVESVVEK
ncbi:MAG TPA: hypothetical protein VGB17_17975 [Pyrinomonadaceae bacterium]|jgi:hypothetical protein